MGWLLWLWLEGRDAAPGGTGHARQDAASLDTVLHFLLVTLKGLTIVVQKTQSRSEKCCSTPKLGH